MGVKINWILAVLVTFFVAKISLDSAMADKTKHPGEDLATVDQSYQELITNY